MIPYEDLSRLLDGDLDDEAAAALRARIAAEPDVAAAWAAMQRLPSDLAALPLRPRPEGLPSPVRAGGWGAPAWFGVGALAAAALLFALTTHATPSVVPSVGEQAYDGTLDVLLPQGRLHVDGVVDLIVEPAEGVVREQGSTEDPMNRTHLVAALAGAAITVAVVEGHATLYPDEGAAPLTLHAGERRALPSADGAHLRGAASARDDLRTPRSRADLPTEPTARVAALQAENDALREALASTQRLVDEQQLQLASTHGKPSPWPSDVAPAWQPDAVRARAEAAAKANGATVQAVDCDEYPCVVAFDIPVGADPNSGQAAAHAIQEALNPVGPGGDASAMQMMQVRDDGSGAIATLVAGFLPSDVGPNDPVQTRLKRRAEEVMQATQGE
jgi:hypothetical protein